MTEGRSAIATSGGKPTNGKVAFGAAAKGVKGGRSPYPGDIGCIAMSRATIPVAGRLTETREKQERKACLGAILSTPLKEGGPKNFAHSALLVHGKGGDEGFFREPSRPPVACCGSSAGFQGTGFRGPGGRTCRDGMWLGRVAT